MTLRDTRAIVTGGTSGIGRAIVEEFVTAGAHVTFCGRNEHRGRQMERTLEGRAEFVLAEVTNPTDVNQLMAAATQSGALDCLVNNAAAMETVPFAQVTSETLTASMQSVFGSVVLVSQAAAAAMRATGGGVIINIGSSVGRRANSSPAIYSSLKAAVLHLTRCLALELAPDSISVNSVSPGAIPTPIFREAWGSRLAAR